MDRTTWSLFVPGGPKSTQTGSVVRAGGRAFPVRRHTELANRIALAANGAKPERFLEGPLAVRLLFLMPKPTSGQAKKRHYPTVRPDLANLEKGLMDALQGIVFADDAAICRLAMEKLYGVVPGVMISVEELSDDGDPKTGGV